MTYADHAMNKVREEILAKHPRMAEPPFLAALGGRMIDACWLELTPRSKRKQACAARGIFGDEAARLIAGLEMREDAYNDRNR